MCNASIYSTLAPILLLELFMRLLLFVSNIGNFMDTPIPNRNVHSHQCRRIVTISVHDYTWLHYLCTPTRSTKSVINKGVGRVT